GFYGPGFNEQYSQPVAFAPEPFDPAQYTEPSSYGAPGPGPGYGFGPGMDPTAYDPAAASSAQYGYGPGPEFGPAADPAFGGFGFGSADPTAVDPEYEAAQASYDEEQGAADG